MEVSVTYLGKMVRKGFAVFDHMSIAIVDPEVDGEIRHVAWNLEEKKLEYCLKEQTTFLQVFLRIFLDPVF